MVVRVEAFSAVGCSRCDDARDALKAVVDEFGATRVTWSDLDIVEKLDYAVELGVVSPPAIAIDRELVFPTLPTPDRLRAELAKRLATDRG